MDFVVEGVRPRGIPKSTWKSSGGRYEDFEVK